MKKGGMGSDGMKINGERGGVKSGKGGGGEEEGRRTERKVRGVGVKVAWG